MSSVKSTSLTAELEAVQGEIKTEIAKIHGELIGSIAAVQGEITAQSTLSNDRVKNIQESIKTALAAADKTTAISQATADKAMAKAEAAADKAYLESQIDGLRQSTIAQIIAQKEAISAALVAAKEALISAMHASERAIAKAEEATEKRFASVNEFRQTLSDQQKNLVVKTEVEFRFAAFEKKLDENYERLNRSDLRMAEYTTIETHNSSLASLTDWRRTVDAALTAASSKSSLAYSAVAVAIAIAGLLVTVVGFYAKHDSGDGGATAARTEIQRQVSALESRQMELIRTTARNPVEKAELDALSKQVDDLIRRLDGRTLKP